MGRVVAIGTEPDIRGFALAGVMLCPAADDAAARRAWSELAPDVTLVILSAEAARAVGDAVDERMTAVMPP